MRLCTGQRYFQSKFGERSDIFWLPDTFGYSSQIPQLCRLADMKYFMTQKLSSSEVNRIPHNTFVSCNRPRLAQIRRNAER